MQYEQFSGFATHSAWYVKLATATGYACSCCLEQELLALCISSSLQHALISALVCTARGSFPLDHHGECKAVSQEFMACMARNKWKHHACAHASRAYLQCRMDKYVASPSRLFMPRASANSGAQSCIRRRCCCCHTHAPMGKPSTQRPHVPRRLGLTWVQPRTLSRPRQSRRACTGYEARQGDSGRLDGSKETKAWADVRLGQRQRQFMTYAYSTMYMLVAGRLTGSGREKLIMRA